MIHISGNSRTGQVTPDTVSYIHTRFSHSSLRRGVVNLGRVVQRVKPKRAGHRAVASTRERGRSAGGEKCRLRVVWGIDWGGGCGAGGKRRRDGWGVGWLVSGLALTSITISSENVKYFKRYYSNSFIRSANLFHCYFNGMQRLRAI